MQARNFTTNVPKILDLKSSSEQIFSRKLSLGAPDLLTASLSISINAMLAFSDILPFNLNCYSLETLLLPGSNRLWIFVRKKCFVNGSLYVSKCLTSSILIVQWFVLFSLYSLTSVLHCRWVHAWHLRGNMKSWCWSFLPYSVLISDIAWNFVILRTAFATQRLEGMSSWFSRTVWNVCRAKSFQKLISFSLFAGPASLLVISLKHPGCEELIDGVMLGERVTKALRQTST